MSLELSSKDGRLGLHKKYFAPSLLKNYLYKQHGSVAKW